MTTEAKSKAVKVLVVEDSAVVREFLLYVLSADSEIQVIGTARHGEEAIEFIEREQPDVITMDIHMPKMDGLTATRRIMESRPVPIIIVSGSSDPKEVATTFQAIEAGAVAVLARPHGIGHVEHEKTAKELIQTVKLMAEVKVVRRWPRDKRAPSAGAGEEKRKVLRNIQAIAIGASTGGPVVLQTILSGLPKSLSAPVLIVQHMAAGFVQGFADWLAQASSFPVHVAAQGELLLPGHAYVAPDGYHLGLGAAGQVALSKQEPENGLRPSVSYLFRSVAAVCGANAVGVLLTGMGKDGAEELKLLKDLGAVTIAQDAESSIVHGMPGEAIKLNAASYVLGPDKIPAMLAGLAANNSKEPLATSWL